MNNREQQGDLANKETNGAGKFVYIAAFSISLMVFLSFSSLRYADFVNLDDPAYVLKNEDIKDLSLDNIGKLFYAPSGDMYIPLVYLSYSIEYYFFDLAAGQFHTDNILLHILNSLLVFWLVWLLTRKLLVSFFLAGLFGLHPLHVESVAWISERKDVLYTFFFLASIICYHFYSKKEGKKYYIFSFIFFVLSCLSKPMAITLPGVLLLYDFFYLKQHSLKVFANKIPYFIVSLLVAIITIKMIDVSYHNEFNANYTILDKIILVLYSVGFYVWKTVFPVSLSAMYTYPIKTGSWLPLYYIICAIGALLVTVFVFFSRRSPTIVKGCFLFYLICIFPVLQFFANTYTITADRYSYVPLLGIFGIAVYYLNDIVERKKMTHRAAWIFAGIVLAGLSINTYGRNEVWKDSLSLYSDIIEKGEYTEAAICALGDAYTDNNNQRAALAVYKRADSMYPNKYAVKVRYAAALGETKQYDSAVMQYQKCLVLDSLQPGVYTNLGSTYLKMNQKEASLNVLLKGHRLFPDDNMCTYNLAYVYWTMDNNREAIKYFRKAAANRFQPAIDFLTQKNISIN